MAPSMCNHYNISEENIHAIMSGTGNITEIQVSFFARKEEMKNPFFLSSQANSELTSCQKWTYDDSEFKDTLVTENDWVCGVAHYVADLFTLGVVGLILGTFVFR